MRNIQSTPPDMPKAPTQGKHRGAVAAGVRAGEQPVLAPERDRADRSLGRSGDTAARDQRTSRPAPAPPVPRSTTHRPSSMSYSVRASIGQAAPGLTELMNDNMPAFALVKGGKRDKQVMIAGYPRHVGFYPHPDIIAAIADRLADYPFAKGSVQFPLSKPIPPALVIEMVKLRLSQLQG